MIFTDTNCGIVYVLSNPVMPGLIKIGMTQRADVDARMRELYGTGVPVPFECEYACKVDKADCLKIEQALHRAFAPNRVNANREFFRMEAAQAMAILELFNREDITQEVEQDIHNELTPDDLAAGEKAKRRMRPALNYREMGIPVGATLVWIADPNITATVQDDRRVLFQGEETSLTAITKIYKGGAGRMLHYWQYDNRRLSEIYDECYPPLEEEE